MARILTYSPANSRPFHEVELLQMVKSGLHVMVLTSIRTIQRDVLIIYLAVLHAFIPVENYYLVIYSIFL